MMVEHVVELEDEDEDDSQRCGDAGDHREGWDDSEQDAGENNSTLFNCNISCQNHLMDS